MQVCLPGVHLLTCLRDLPVRLVRRLYRSELPLARRMRTLADIIRREWGLLAEEPGTEIVIGAVGKFWQPVIEWRQVAAADFAGFNQPGYAKLAVNFSIQPYGA